MSKADELRAKAARVAARTTTPKQATSTTPEQKHVPTVAAPLAKVVRSTVDLPPELHRGLQAWINDAATELGRARLSKQEVMVALVRRLLVDADLAAAVKRDLQASQ